MIAADPRAHRGARSALALTLLGAGMLVHGVAAAEGPSRADILYRQARVLLDAKKYDEACPKLAESHRLEPGAGTLLALALCHEGQGKTATASAELKEASLLGRKNGRNELAAAAEKRAQALEASVPRLKVVLPANGGPYRVNCDDEPIAAADLASPLPMDPGEHHIDVFAPGKKPRTYVVRISGPGTTEIVVDRLEDTAGHATAAAPAASASASESSRTATAADTNVEPPEDEPSTGKSRGGTQRAIGLVLVGAGVVGLGTGAVFVGTGLSTSRSSCPKAGACPEDKAANEQSKQSLQTGLIALTAGTVALTAGAIVYFLAPSANDPSATSARVPPRRTARIVPTVGPNGASLGVFGTF